MPPRGFGGQWLLAASLLLLAPTNARGQTAALADEAVAFWLAPDDEARSEAAAHLLQSAVHFGEWVAALRGPPPYPTGVSVGRLDRVRDGSGGIAHPYTALIPAAYDPSRAYPVLVYLHGGVNRPAWQSPGEWWRDYDRVADPERIVVVPAGWRASPWWRESQVENLAGILRDLGRSYHLDTDRVHLVGISDGASGAYYHAFRAATPWASFLSFIGHPAVLSSPRLGVDGQMYVTNLRNRPLMIVNGGRDRLYPADSVEPFIRLFRDHGVSLVYRPQSEAGHDLSWLPAEAARVDSFINATTRDPLPDVVEWETEDPATGGRFSWVVIDELGATPDDSELPDRNALRVPGDPETYLAFPHPRASGQVRVERRGNRVIVRTDGVRRLRLLISPDEFDLSRPIRVELNGRVRFDEPVAPSRETLLQWAMRDADRSMLFAAEISLDV